MPRVFEYLMSSIAREERKQVGPGSKVTYTVRASFLEVFNEKIFDLFEPSSGSGSGSTAGSSLQLREDSQRGVFVDGLSEEPVRSAMECQELMVRGAQARRVGETALNRESSRSHSVFSLSIRSSVTHGGRTVDKHSRFNLIDRQSREHTARERLAEL
jgi:kinesin family protein 15